MNAKLKVPENNAPTIDFNKPVRRLLYEDLLTGDRKEILLYVCPDRIDQFRVFINGKLWRERLGWTHVLTALRKSVGRFSPLPT